jgi:hypothetical protein
MALYYTLKEGIVIPPVLDFLLIIALTIRGLSGFRVYYMIAFSISVQNVIGF